jgi:hypothetical protein
MKKMTTTITVSKSTRDMAARPTLLIIETPTATEVTVIIDI